MHQPTEGHSTATEIQIERVNAAFDQVPVASGVNVINAGVMLFVLNAAGQQQGAPAWLLLAVAVSTARLASWWAFRRARPPAAQYRRWAAVSALGAFAAGALWGGGSVVLFPESETYQLFWAFLIAGMCAGAAAIHYAHLASTLAFIFPAGIPLALRFAFEGAPHRIAASAMIAVFLAALVVTANRASRYFGDMVRLRIALAHRTRELDSSNARLQAEMAERRATEESLRHAQKMEAVGQLTGGIAHDFNNLLTAVLGNLSLLRKRLPADDPATARLLENATHGAERGAALTQRLLAFGRRQALHPELVHLQAAIPGMAALLHSSLGTTVQLVIRLPEALPPVQIDANQLELALLNLAVNARDAMPEGGDVTITAREETPPQAPGKALPPSFVVLSIADTGIGMDETTLARAAEPFFTTKDIGKGTGLGLAMVHGFAAQSGGELVLASRRNLGTVAELWLPRAQAAMAAARPANAPPSPAHTPLLPRLPPL